MGRPIPAEVSNIVPVNADVIDRKIAKVTASHADRKQRISDLNSKLDDITLNGVQSAPLRAHYGDAVNFSDNSFKAIHGKTKGAAVAEKHAQVRDNMLAEQYLANRQVKRLATLKEARKNVTLTPAEKILAHHGVKGMKWGVRNDAGHEGESAKTKKISKLDGKFEKEGNSLKTVVELHNRAAELTNKNDIERINNKPQYKDKNFDVDSPLRRKYYDEHQNAFIKNLQQAAEEHGTNASGTRKYKITTSQDGTWNVATTDVTHADANLDANANGSFKVNVKYDSTGHIIGVDVPDNAVQHHGIKGMRWGVRKADDDASSSGGKSGGGHEEDSDDVKKVNAAKAKIAKSGSTSVLSNEDLQRVVSRMNLDQQYSNLTKEKSDLEKGNDNAKKVLDLIGTVQKAHTIYNSPLGKSVKKGVKDARKTVKVYKRARRIAKLARDAVQVAAVVA